MIYPNATYYIVKAEDLEHREGVSGTMFMVIGFITVFGSVCRIMGKRMGIRKKI